MAEFVRTPMLRQPLTMPARLMVPVVVGILALIGCGDPQTYVGVQNDDAVDYLVALAEPGYGDIPSMYVVRAGATRTVNLNGQWHGMVGLVETGTCRLLDLADIDQLDNLLVIQDGQLVAGEATREGRFVNGPDGSEGCRGFELPAD
jgi:hypothetical protein